VLNQLLPKEGPLDVAPDTTASSGPQTNSVAQTEESRDVEAETVWHGATNRFGTQVPSKSRDKKD
jgi:hypothetical protein